MIRSRPHALATALAGLLVLAAAPGPRPVFPPTRDVAVRYQADVRANGAPPTFLLRYSAASQQARLDSGAGSYVLVDLRAPQARLVVPAMRLIFDLPAGSGLEQALSLGGDSRFERAGQETIAGLPCTLWRVNGREANGTACVTAQGVVLAAQGRDRQGRAGSVRAIAVAFGPEPPSLFAVPPGMREVRLASPALP